MIRRSLGQLLPIALTSARDRKLRSRTRDRGRCLWMAEVLEERTLLAGAAVVDPAAENGSLAPALVDTTSTTTIPAVEGLPIPHDSVLASFTSDDPLATPSDFVLQVDWGTTNVINVDNFFANESFERPGLIPGGYVYLPTVASQGGAGWAFAGLTGVTGHDGPFNMYQPPSGQQAAFLESGYPGIPGSLSQTFSVSAQQTGWTTVSFMAEGRSFYGASTFQVLLDGVPLEFGGSTTVTPATFSRFSQFTSDAIELTTGSHTLTFQTQDSVPNLASFIDAVRIDPAARIIPDPDYIGTGSGWLVVGNAIYTNVGTYPVTVTVTEVGNGSPPIAANDTSVVVSAAPLTDTTIPSPVATVEGLPLPGSTVLATFLDANPFATPDDFLVEVFSGTTGIGGVLANNSFERPGYLPGAYEYAPSLAQQGGTGWTFNSSAGITNNFSQFNMYNPPNGQQAAFLQAAASQTGAFQQAFVVSGSEAGWTTLSFFAEARGNGPGTFRVTLDGVPLWFAGADTVTPTTPDSFKRYISDAFNLSAGTHVLAFESLPSTVDATSFIDTVRLNPFYEVVQDESYSGAGSAWKVVGGLTYPTSGTFPLTVQVTDIDDSSNTFTTPAIPINVAPAVPPERQILRQTGLAGFYYTDDGRLGQLLQNDQTIILVDPDGDTWPGTITNDADLDIPGLGVTGTFNPSAGTVSFSDGEVWSKVRTLTGQWWTSRNGIGGIRQLGTELTLKSGEGADATGRFISPTEIVVEGWTDPGTLFHGELVAGGARIEWENGVVWNLIPDLSGDWQNSGSKPTRIEQQGTTLLFVNASGQTSLGTYIDPTHVQVGQNWGGLTGTISGNAIDFSNGTRWSIPAAATGYPDLGGLWQTSTTVADTRVLQAGQSLTFVNRTGQTSSGYFLSATQVFATDWNAQGTIVGNQIIWPSNAWTQIPALAGPYLNQSNHETGVTQLERSLTFTDMYGNVTHGTLVGLTQIQETDGSHRSALLAGGSLFWSNGPVWKNLPFLATNWRDANGAPAYIEQSGLKLLYIDDTGTSFTGGFLSRTQVQLREGLLGTGAVVNVWVPDAKTLQLDHYAEWNRYPPMPLDNVFADRNFWPFA